jgi:polar amino acid transport system ATP-binding protein
VVPGFRQTILDWMREVTALGHRVMAGIARSLDLPADYFARRYTADPLILFRIFNYPSRPIPAGSTCATASASTPTTASSRCCARTRRRPAGAHARGLDRGAAVPESFVCNIGDMLDRMTGGLYRSTPHRVLLNTSAATGSRSVFFDPERFDARIGPSRGRQRRHATRGTAEGVHAFEGTYGGLPARQGRQGFRELRRELNGDRSKPAAAPKK